MEKLSTQILQEKDDRIKELEKENINLRIKINDYKIEEPKFNMLWSQCDSYDEDEIEDLHVSRFIFGNCFKAEQRAKEIKIYNLLKNFSDINGGNKIDWGNPSQEKYYLHYDYNDLSFCISFDYQTKSIHLVYFISYEVAAEALRRYRKELEEIIK